MDADGGKVSFLQPWGHGRVPRRQRVAWRPFMVSTDRVQWIMKQGKEKKEMKMKLQGVGEEKWGMYYLTTLLKNIELKHKNKQLSDRRQDYTVI